MKQGPDRGPQTLGNTVKDLVALTTQRLEFAKTAVTIVNSRQLRIIFT